MKGLLMKDFYMMKKYCRGYFFILVIFLVIAAVSGDEMTFFQYYPAILIGLIPITLLSYDERSNWNSYSQTLPFSRAQLVTVKYLIGLILEVVVIALITVVSAISMSAQGIFSFGNLVSQALFLIILATLFPTIDLPLVFYFGVEKGRIVNLIIVAAVCVIAFFLTSWASDTGRLLADVGMQPMIWICIVVVACYFLSWRLSIGIYRKREI